MHPQNYTEFKMFKAETRMLHKLNNEGYSNVINIQNYVIKNSTENAE